MKIIFFGTPDFAVTILKALIDAHMSPIAVVTTPDKPAGRGHIITSPPVKTFVEKYTIPVFQPEKLKDETFLHTLQNLNADVFVIASYGKILPQNLLDIPLKGTINVHPSLLPRHRGPSPIQSAILAGDSTTGITLMLTDKEMDHGPIIATCSWHIADSNSTYAQLHDKLAELGGDLLVKTLPRWIAGEITPQEQHHPEATYTKLLTKEDGHIDWTKSAKEIDRMVRALNPWPGTWSTLSEAKPPIFSKIGGFASESVKRVKILAGHPLDEKSTVPAGTILKTKSGHLAACTKNGLYMIEMLQVEGKKATLGTNLLNELSHSQQAHPRLL
ncbi:MAG: methionyl-tRNA formyltransferase [Candidatus Ryanbacteria bacterium RIFCSPHIGHO2_02_FULL_45_17b]|uniref:Methionyl-tRNA formyltransferase n=1 Tax=Candidatus Ryanbacteria bacterium RIFCSPHIGHO2_01_FULL_45_22 TaxID=1802114 RepID=A0A1G2G0S4_9BACT|nr:MAG: methionyl-tRNA formyltransferase [Candidatus Ryanbacteria bacterium RIFCSPHIGHO2_01_FULL_45_22]OGZ47049.1 MAG: methionyl-tRNA formyltransferase [Candidatus Ryanbacteria bacterium RIFCSPHIGHO2_02_FULL_45_17b]